MRPRVSRVPCPLEKHNSKHSQTAPFARFTGLSRSVAPGYSDSGNLAANRNQSYDLRMIAAANSPGPFEVQRRWKRYQIRVPVRLVVHRGDVSTRINGRGTELNEGGMCIFAGVELNNGDQVELEFTAPYAPEPLRIWASVRNRYGYYYGFEFLTENNGERQEVEKFREVLRSATGNA
jgi:hypothetical protein